MKKTYLIPETTLHELNSNEAVMDYLTMPVYNGTTTPEEEVTEFEFLLSNQGNRLWEEEEE